MAVRYRERVRVTLAEYETLRQAAELQGQGHWMPNRIEERGDRLQAEAAAAGSLLLDVLFDRESRAARAYRAGQISMLEVLQDTAELSRGSELEHREVTRLNAAEAERFAKALAEPPRTNDRLLRAIKRRRESIADE